MRTETKTLIKACRILARDIQSDDGVANAALAEIADRLEELEKDPERLDWLEKQDCWIGIAGEYYAEPIISAGGCYTQKVRTAIDSAMEETK